MTASIGQGRESREVIPREEREEREVIKRVFQIKRADVLAEGITPNCPECERVITGRADQNHIAKRRHVWEKKLLTGRIPE